MSVALHGNLALEDCVNVDTTVQEKNITYPTYSKLAIKIMNRLNKHAKAHGILQRRTFVKEVKSLRLDIRHYRSVKKRAKARRALKRLRTIAGILMRELRRELPQHCLNATSRIFYGMNEYYGNSSTIKTRYTHCTNHKCTVLPRGKITNNMNTAAKYRSPVLPKAT